ncbi:MAG: spore cortex biosynthesis protein YabQ [Aristaeellaceae bacterium]
MMLENLFAQAVQAQLFLWLMAGGLGLGALHQLSRALRRRSRMAGLAGDVLTALTLGLVLLWTLTRFGTGLRAYGLLGLVLGLALYLAGVSPLMSAVGQGAARLGSRMEKFRRKKEGFPMPDAEIISTNDEAEGSRRE